MKSISMLTLLLFALSGIQACKSTATNVDYNTEINFAQFSQYSLAKPAMNADTDTLTNDRIEQAIVSQLSAVALTQSDQTSPLQVSYFSSSVEKENKSLFSIGVGGSSHGSSSSTGIGLGTSFPMGADTELFTQITIDFNFEGKLIWRGVDGFTTDHDVDPGEKNQKIQNTVQKILSQYPPKP